MSESRRVRPRPEPKYASFEVDRQGTRAVLDKVSAAGRMTIGDSEARQILSAYGLPIPKSEIAATQEEAMEIARQIGYPVVLKIASPDILHHTAIGGRQGGLRSAEEGGEAFELMVYRAQRYVPGAHIWGCLVQEM